MDPRALDFLTSEHVCVFSVVLPDGTPHGATVHFSHATDPVRLFVQTYPTVKVEALREQGGLGKASVVVGFDDRAMKTLQMRGEARIATDAQEIASIEATHYAKTPSAKKHRDEETVFIVFTPTWWRYSDFTTQPETTIEG